MNIGRRSLMKGMLAGGALLALGTPPWAFAGSPVRRPNHCVLLLGDTVADDVFERGARAACTGMNYDGLQTLTLKEELLTNPGAMAKLLEQSKGSRWIAVMDDASAAVFQELVRELEGRLLSIGSHACSDDGACPLRHVWLTASPAQSVGGLLASQLIGRRGSFAVTENFLQGPLEGSASAGWSALGFTSYRLTGSGAMHLHCSGLSLSDGCTLLDVGTTEGWTTLPPQVCEQETITWQSDDWAESVGYAVAASALGVSPVQESCSDRAFVHRSCTGERMQPTERFVSFVIDL
jgi:hypothetical protein